MGDRLPDAIDLSPPSPDAPAAGPLTPYAASRHRPETVVLGDFRIHGKIGTGTQGAVYLAHQTSRGRSVALKVFTGDAALRSQVVARFTRESVLLGRLDHPNIVRGYGAGEEHGFHYFAMEYVDGPNAAAVLRRAGGRLPAPDALHVAIRCAEALAAAAACRVIHRDVKPSNILVSRRGDVKLSDWGLAKPTDEDHALTGAFVRLGTLRYVAPEQARDPRRADQRSDVYALGGVLYEFLTGEVPFAGTDWLAVLRAKEDGPVPAASRTNAAVPRRCDAILSRMLAPDPADRYPDYASLIGDLRGIGLAGDRLDLSPLDGPADPPPAGAGRRLQVLLVYDEMEYVLLAQHALHAAGIPHDLSVVEDGQAVLTAAGPLRGGIWGPGPDVLILGLTSPTQASLQLLAEVRRRCPPNTLLACGLSKSPDGAALLRSLELCLGLWVTAFGDLKPLSERLRSSYEAGGGGTAGQS